MKDLVKDMFYYSDGDLIRKITTSPNAIIGDIAGTLQGHGYMATSINGKKYYNHRIIFLIMKGFLPDVIDHIDGNPLNNKIENLRACDQSKNSMNAKLSKRNKSGVKGVSWHKSKERWCAELRIKGQRVFCKYYKRIEKASIGIGLARKKYHGEFANNGI